MRSTLIRSLIFGPLLAVLILTLWYRHQQETPLRTTGTDVPDAAKAGDVNYSMQKARKLMTLLQANNWDWHKIPFEMETLPDQKFAEWDGERNAANTGVFCHCTDAPEQASLAFTVDIYARFNRSYYKGDLDHAKPSGFFIVGYRDGRIAQIPVSQIRCVPSPTTGSEVNVFPGMPNYEQGKPDSMWQSN